MALDPSVITQVNPPTNPLAMVGEYANAAKALAGAANEKAALPGIQADSAVKQRAASFNQWLSDNAGKYIQPQVDDQGKPVTGGAHAVDYSGLISAAANAGYVEEAQTVAASDLKNQATALSNGLTAASTAQTQAATNGYTLDNGNKALVLGINARNNVATVMDAYTKQNPGATPQQIDQKYNQLIGGVQDQFGKALSVYSVFGAPDQPAVPGANGQQGTPASYKFDPAENKAFLTATMSPQVQQELSNYREQLAMTGASGNSGPAYRDVNSPESKAAQRIAIAADPAHADIYATMPASQLASNSTVGGAVTASLVPVGDKLKAVDDMRGHIVQAKQFGNAADALDALKAKFGTDPTFTQLGPIAWIQNNAARFANDPTFAAAQSLLGNVNQVHPELKLAGMTDAAALSSALKAQRNNELDVAGAAGAVATATTASGAAGAVATASGQSGASATKPQGGNTKVDQERNAANAAIKKGAPADAVKARFKAATGQDL